MCSSIPTRVTLFPAHTPPTSPSPTIMVQMAPLLEKSCEALVKRMNRDIKKGHSVDVQV